MIRVTYLGHSGFLLEWPECTWLFDWWTGDLPPLRPDKPLLVFASHRHEDHFSPRIFQIVHPNVRYLLSGDIRLTERNRDRWAVPKGADILSLRRRETVMLEIGGEALGLTTLPSTDEGVAFLLDYQGKTVYHAGDLNWWHWEGEDVSWNHNMAVNFKKAVEPLRSRPIDLAFAPLDPRLESAYDRGLAYLLETARVARVFPMHFWDNFGLTAQFRADHPSLASPLMDITGPGESWELSL